MDTSRHFILLGVVAVVAVVGIIVMVGVRGGGILAGHAGGILVGDPLIGTELVKNGGFEADGNQDYFPGDWDDATAGNNYPNGWLNNILGLAARYCTPGSPPCTDGESSMYHHGGCCSFKLPALGGSMGVDELFSVSPAGTMVKVSGWIRVDAECMANPQCHGRLDLYEMWRDENGGNYICGTPLEAAAYLNTVRSLDWQKVSFQGNIAVNVPDFGGIPRSTNFLVFGCTNSDNVDYGSVFCDDLSVTVVSGGGASPFNVKSPLPTTPIFQKGSVGYQCPG